MSWQLWVVIALVAAALVLLAAARMRHARRVFDDITDLGHRADTAQPADAAADELARARARHTYPASDRPRKHG